MIQSRLDSVYEATRYRTIWLSGVDLSADSPAALRLHDFLRYTTAEYIYLTGLKRPLSPTPASRKALQALKAAAHAGSRITVIPDQKDSLPASRSEGFLTRRFSEHISAKEERFLVLAGTEFTHLPSYLRWIFSTKPGLRSFKHMAHHLAQRARPHPSKHRAFIETACAEGLRRRYAGIICGCGIPCQQEKQGFRYANIGHWHQHETALVEHFNGSMEMLRGQPLTNDQSTPIRLFSPHIQGILEPGAA